MAKKKKAKAKTRTNKKTKAKAKALRKRGPAKAKRGAARPKAVPKSAKRRAPATKRAPARVTSLPDMEVETTSGGRLNLASLKGRNVVLYFYPKDDTPGCTTEGCEIRDRYADFERHDTVVYGVSRDGVDSHERFKAKFGFPFELIADPDEKLCRAFGVIQQKSLYGRSYMGVDRSTFIFDRNGALRKEFRNVKAAGHADQILEEIRKL